MSTTEIFVFTAHRKRNVFNNFSAFVSVATQISDWFERIGIFSCSNTCVSVGFTVLWMFKKKQKKNSKALNKI